MAILKIISDTNCSVRCDFHEVGNIQAGELFKLQLKKGCYILEFLVEDIVIVSMDYTIETNDEEPLFRLNIKEQAEKKIREQKYIRNKSAKVNIYVDNNRFILDNEDNNPVVLPKEYILYYQSADGQYTEDAAGLIPFYTTVVEEKIKNGEIYQIDKTLYGSLNKLGEIAIKPIYTTPVVFFNDVIAKTTSNKTRCYLNHYGEEIGLSCLNTDAFSIRRALDKNCNLFIAQSTENESLWGVVRFDKKIIVSISNNTIYENTDNFIWALKGDTLSIYDNEGKWIKSIRYVDLGEIDLPYRRKHQDYVFVHKEAVAVRVSGYWGLYDFDGDVKIPHIYKVLDAYWVYSDYDYESGKEFLTGDGYGSSPLMFVKKKNGGYGIININVFDVTNGILDINNIKEVIPCKYDAVYSNDGKRIEELKENFFQHYEQDNDRNWVEGIGDDIFFVKYYDGLMECDYFCTQMLRYGKKDKEEHFVCKEFFNEHHYIDEDGNPHLREKHGDYSSYDKEELINTSRHALVYSEDGLSIIGCDKTFEGEIIVPEGIEYIAERAFANCKLTSVYIPDSVTSIGDHAFNSCENLTSVTIGNSVTSIGDSAFRVCRSLTSVTIPKSVTSIGDYAFAYCSRLTSIIIPNSVMSIGDYAFAYCSRLTSIIIPNSVMSIGYFAFVDCWDLTTIVVEKGNIKYDSRNNCNAIIETSSNTLIAGCNNTTIPNNVTSIGDCAFASCKGLTSITIPNSVTSIGNSAFEDCYGLTSIVIPNNVTSIGDDAFERCESLTSVTIGNSVTSIGFGAFKSCSRLTTIAIPNSVTRIRSSAFEFCSGLTSVKIGNSVTIIENGAFFGCSSLLSITIPNSVTNIRREVFRCCRSLTSIIIPNSVMSIGDSVFRDCDNLKEIIIPKGTKAKFEELLPDQKDKLVEQEEMTNNETMDRILYFDTETTGVPLNYKAPSSDTNNWPRLVQLAWILTDEEGTRIHTGNLVVKPDGFVIPADATKVHGITTQRAKEEGVPLAEVIERFMSDLDMATYIVGHNIEFDKKIVGAEMIRLGMKDELEKKKSCCTMLSSIDFCKIPGKYGFKYPKLQELYRKLFGEDFEDAHNAMCDIEATEKCFWELRKRKLV